VRALQPWPGSFLEAGSDRLVVWAADVLTGEPSGPSPGSLVRVDDGLALVTADGWLALREVQPAGGRRMTGGELVRGRPSLAESRVRDGRVR
jgi:methionyl-tRNA formyltransferase